MTALELPAVDATRANGWLATLGATRVLAARWPDLTLHFAGAGHPVLGDGPATLDDAVDVLRADTLGAIPDGGVLPGLDPAYPPPGSAWWRRPDEPLVDPADWGDDLWQAAILSPRCLLHPLISPHAAQTVRGMFATAGNLLRKQPDLLAGALFGSGLTSDYPGGLWLRLYVPDKGSQPNQASPGRDWLALMALPWMPAVDDTTAPVPGVPYRRGAAGWRWRATGQGFREHVYEWHLWDRPVPASLVPTLLASPSPFLPAGRLRFGARRAVRGRNEPPLLREFTRAEIQAGALDDVEVYEPSFVAQLANVRVATLTGYVARGQCPSPDAIDDAGNPGWRTTTILPWLRREKSPGRRTDRRPG